MPIKGFVIKEKDKNNYYCGSKMGHKFSGFYGAKMRMLKRLGKDFSVF